MKPAQQLQIHAPDDGASLRAHLHRAAHKLTNWECNWVRLRPEEEAELGCKRVHLQGVGRPCADFRFRIEMASHYYNNKRKTLRIAKRRTLASKKRLPIIHSRKSANGLIPVRRLLDGQV